MLPETTTQPWTVTGYSARFQCICCGPRGKWIGPILLLIAGIACVVVGATIQVWPLMGIALGVSIIVIAFLIFMYKKQKRSEAAKARGQPPQNPHRSQGARNLAPLAEGAEPDKDFGPPPSYKDVTKE